MTTERRVTRDAQEFVVGPPAPPPINRVVWKFTLELTDHPQKISIPTYANILHVGSQDNQPVFWAEVQQPAIHEDRWFVVHGTGHPIHINGNYMGTAETHGGQFVWHLYEVPEWAAKLTEDNR
jgi:hypothetical protein